MSASIPEYFDLFGLAPRFAIDQDRLARSYREVQSRVHPDRFATAGAAERRAAMQLSSHANQAYEVLRSDSARASYLCTRAGVNVDGPGAPPLEPRFLEHQMALREALESAQERGDAAALVAMSADLVAQRAQLVARIAAQLDEQGDTRAAAASVRALMFLDKLGAEIARFQRAGQGAPAGR